MGKCVNCGGKSLKLSSSGETKKCGDCGCSNLVVRTEHVAAAARMQRLLASGWPHVVPRENLDG
jgi:hypothetical protein